jgi:hypothetical protein
VHHTPIPGRKKDRHSKKHTATAWSILGTANGFTLMKNKSITLRWTAIALVRRRPKKNEVAKFQISKQGKM